LAGEGQANWLTGSAEVTGEAKTLVARAAMVLVQDSLHTLCPIQILEKTDDRLRFEQVRNGVGSQQAGWGFRQGELRFTPLGPGATHVAWAIELTNLRWLLWLGGLFQAAGLVALVAGCWVVYTYVASSPNPTVRWQTFQMLQVVHFLWPPFLFGTLYRRGERAVAARFEALVHNLPYYGD
jgi:hypothetical protein